MKKTKLRGVISLIMLTALLIGMLPTVHTEAKTTQVDKIVTSHDIAVVYDNSGSMYYDGSATIDRWSKAQYAIEVFASMLDFDSKDRMTVYPMWPIKTDGSSDAHVKYNGDYSNTSFTVESKSDLSKLKNMFTPQGWGTPFDPVKYAAQALANSSKDEKWLIILTDGNFNSFTEKGIKNKDIPPADVVNYIKGYTQSANIRVQYIGINVDVSGIRSSASGGSNINVYGGTNSDIKQDLITACNQIFKRDTLVGKDGKNNSALSGNTLKLDISMSKIIVFVQGNGAKVKSLKNSSGTAIESSKSDVTYNQLQKEIQLAVNRDIGFVAPLNDTTLMGQIATFTDCAKGTYTLELEGGAEAYKNVQIFYEPDVDLKITVKSAETNNEVITNDDFGLPYKDLPEGEYIIEYKLVDRVDRSDVSGNALIGNVKYIDQYLQTKNGTKTQISNGQKIKIKEDEETELVLTAQYLDKYTISTKEIRFPKLHVTPPSADESKFEVKAYTESGNNKFKRSEIGSWDEVKVEFKYNGQALPQDQFDKLEISDVKVSPEGGIKATAEKKNGYYTVKFSGGDVKSGDYTLSLKATLNGFSNKPSKNASFDFKVQASDFKIELQNVKGEYERNNVENWEPITAKLTLDGQPLAEPLEYFKVELSPEMKVSYEKISDSEYRIYLAKDGGFDTSFKSGDYTVTALAKLKDDPTSTDARAQFKVKTPDFNVEIKDVKGEYKKSEYADWAPAKIKINLGGAPLTQKPDEVKVEITPSMPYMLQETGDPSEYILYLAKDASGNPDPNFGSGDFTVKATVTMQGGMMSADAKAAFKVQTASFSVNVDTDQAGHWYCINEKDGWKPVTVTFSYEGGPITDSQFDEIANTLKISVQGKGDVKYVLKPNKEQRRFEIDLGIDEQGNFVKPAKGGYTVTASASITDASGDTLSSDGSTKFSVRAMPFWMLLLIIFLILLGIAILVVIFMSMKVLPKDIIADDTRFSTMNGNEDIGKAKVRYSRKKKQLVISTPGSVPYGQMCTATFKLAARDRRWTRSSKRNFSIVSIKAPTAREVSVNALPYRYNESLHGYVSTMGTATALPKVLINSVGNATVAITNNQENFSNQATLTVQLKRK